MHDLEELRDLVDEGLSTEEIADRLTLTRPQVLRLARRLKVPLARPGLRQVRVQLTPPHFAVVRELARDAQVSPSAMLVRMTTCLLEGGREAARRRLGKQAQPRRAYRKRDG